MLNAPLSDGRGEEHNHADPAPCRQSEAADSIRDSAKLADTAAFRSHADGHALTTDLGVRISDNQNTLRAGQRGPSLMQDFLFLEKMAHFDQERIPERVVHARGSGAHGVFRVYRSLSEWTKAEFLQDPEEETPVFVRFSTVQGFRGSPDTVRDIRGWATKFYTKEGNFDLVGNNTPVFFIQDAIKFPDFVHAVKPEPRNEIPQGQSAHDSFWDYVSLQPETLHNVMWAMSDRGIPRSYRMMEGFGIHTYRLVNARGESRFVRFHWKPAAGLRSLVWDEAQLLTGRDPDFHRRDLWEAIEAGDYPEYELGLQIIPEDEAALFDFDILDPTKLIPEALVPVQLVGRMTLNRNPDNFFAETEQAAFCPANIVPGIDFSEDPLLQGRIFSYSDTQRHRLGGPNFTELPINRPICPVHNHRRDGQHRLRIDADEANYEPNTLSGNWPRETPLAAGGFSSCAIRLEGVSQRLRSPSFAEHYAHPRLFWLSQTEPEKRHIIGAFSFELGKVRRTAIRERVLDLLANVDSDLARGVASNLGIELTEEQLSRPVPGAVSGVVEDASLSLYARSEREVRSLRVSLLAADGVSARTLKILCSRLRRAGVHPAILAPHSGPVTMDDGRTVQADGDFSGNPSVLFDAVLVPDGEKSTAVLAADADAGEHVALACRHLKALGFVGEAECMAPAVDDDGIIRGTAEEVAEGLLKALAKHRIWTRERPRTSAARA